MKAIKKGDRVKVISGKEKGRQGQVLKVYDEDQEALVERLNMVKRHTRAGGSAGKQGGIIEKEAPIKISNLMLMCPKCKKAARTGTRVLDDDERVRYCKKCGEQISG
jgi:large subunit ribosomal protein L24